MAKTAQQDKFLEGLRLGLLPAQAAGRANYKQPAKHAYQLMNDKALKPEISAIYAEIRKESRITRLDIEKGVLDAIQMARLMSDPTAMIRGYAELNKMQGNYAPEKREVTVNGMQRRLATELESFTDQELVELVSQEGTTYLLESTDYHVVEGEGEGEGEDSADA